MSGKFEMVDLIREGCELSRYFPGLYQVTAGDPCKDCATVSTCPVKIKLSTKPKINPSIPTETNAQIAARLGITKRQVAKRRKEGTLDVQGNKS